jgi:hypothetical protein
MRLALGGLLILLLAASASGTTYPSLIECVCNTTLASAAVVTTSTSSGSQTQKYTIPSCVDDVFAQTGIRWYIDGPILGSVTYWRKATASTYLDGRAAKRLQALGYRCERVQLYDSTDTSVY